MKQQQQLTKLAYTVKNFGVATDLPYPTIKRAIEAGELQAMTSGNRIIITHEAGVAWLRSCQEKREIPAPAVSQEMRERFAALNRKKRLKMRPPGRTRTSIT